MVQVTQRVMALSKPRVVALLVFTAACGMWRAAEGTPPLEALVVVMLAGAMAAAGSAAINQALDSDIDATMRRTQGRPVPSHQVSRRMALLAGSGAIAVGVVAMGTVVNWFSALLTLGAAAIYVFVYTLLLKRRVWHNIVIGGAAGALPPLIGSVAVTGGIDAPGLFMFGIIFFWTPPHFWTLSLLLKEDYTAARLPMLSAVAGERDTAQQILLYALLLVVLAWLPYAAGYSTPVFPAVATLLGLEWIRRAWPLRGGAPRSKVLRAYLFSFVYLTGVFLTLAVEPLLPWY